MLVGMFSTLQVTEKAAVPPSKVCCSFCFFITPGEDLYVSLKRHRVRGLPFFARLEGGCTVD